MQIFYFFLYVVSLGQKETLWRVRLEVVKKIFFPIMPWDTLTYTNVKILTSAIKSDHRASVATDGRLITSRSENPVVVNFRRRSPEQNASLLRLLAEMDYGEVVDCPDLQMAWNLFYTSALSLLESVYPMRRVTMTTADPPYLTPATKTMLRRKNRLM